MSSAGSGIHVYRDGNRYEGEWKNGKKEGQGTFWVAKEGRYNAMYRGTWKSGKWHVSGRIYILLEGVLFLYITRAE